MKKVFSFIAFLSFLIASCSSNGQKDNEQNELEDSSSSVFISSSDAATPSSSSNVMVMPSSSDIALPSSSDIALPSSSDVATPSSSSGETLSSASGATSSSSSSSKQGDIAGDLVCTSKPAATATDYSNKKNWSVYTENPTKEVDIFLLYPTAIQGNAAEDCPYANINNTSMRNQVDQWYRGLGKVATEHVNAYLPYYRQANVFGGCSGGQANMTGGAAMEDVLASFIYYLENINKGKRPFIMLGFSQGSSPLWELAVNRLDTICGKDFGAANRQNHIVTYATGIPSRSTISASKPVKFSESYNDINVITAWNPYWESDTACTGTNQLGVRALSGPTTNPITWTTDENYHAMTENPLLNQNTILGARSYNKLGILLVKRKTEPATDPGCASTGNMYMGQHGNDIPYFSASIIQNMKDRIDAWNAKYR